MSTILVVDDRPESRDPIAKLLRREGFNVICASNAIEAMAAAKTGSPDLILLDVMIPPMDGLTFLSLLRDDPGVPKMPVFLITGLSDQQTMTRARELGVKEYLIKAQFTFDDLLEMIRRHLGLPR